MAEVAKPAKKKWFTGWRRRAAGYLTIASVFGIPSYFVEQDSLITAHPIAAIIIFYFSFSGFLTIWLYANEFAVMAAMGLYGVPPESFKFSILAWALRRSRGELKFKKGVFFSASFAYASTIYGFALTYRALMRIDANSFKEPVSDLLTALYFSIVTIATVGFGDIVPRTAIAKTIVAAEILIGVIYSIFFFSIIAGFIKESQNQKNDLSTDT
jgi:voltage-gated potassium channel Kch